jgi:hypothetical protein
MQYLALQPNAYAKSDKRRRVFARLLGYTEISTTECSIAERELIPRRGRGSARAPLQDPLREISHTTPAMRVRRYAAFRGSATSASADYP